MGISDASQDRLWVEAELPFALLLPDGGYPAGGGRVVELRQVLSPDGLSVRTTVGLESESLLSDTPEAEQRMALRTTERLLEGTNRLLRWYRVKTGNIAVGEVSSWQLSPFRVALRRNVGGHVESLPRDEIRFEATKPSVTELGEGWVTELKEQLASGVEPAVPDLFLQDALAAYQQGRFREAVLFAWATIDSQFNAVYRRLIHQKLEGDYSDGRQQLLGLDLSLRTKMTVILQLLAEHSLFRRGLLPVSGSDFPVAMGSAMESSIVARSHSKKMPGMHWNPLTGC